MIDITTSAAERLRAGGLVAFPTETVYGLGADATSADAVARVYAAKGRPQFNPLITHVASLDAARTEAVFTPLALALADRFWPGPLTLVLPRASGATVCDLACAGLASIGLRIPDQPLALELLTKVGRPVAAPSANRSGRLSPTRAQDVTDDLGDAVDLIVDGGACRVGVESTIIGLAGDNAVLLRPGGIPREEIETLIGKQLGTATGSVTAPGMLASHYAPRAHLRLGAEDVGPDEIGLDFAGRLGARAVEDLSPRGDTTEAAARLFLLLRHLDATGAPVIAVATVPEHGLGAAINDRLRRAAAPRN